MKFAAAILLACVAVSSAAFTANLVQQTQPAMAKAAFSMRLAVGSNKNSILDSLSGIAQQIMAQVMEQAGQLLANAQDALAHGQQIAGAVVAQLTTLANTLHQSVLAGAQTLGDNISAFLQQLGLGNRKLNLAQAIQAAQQQIEAVLTQAQALAQQLITQIDLPTMIQNAINAIFPQNVAQLIIAHMQLNNKGAIGDFFGNLFGGVWDAATQAASQFAAQIASIASAISQAGSSAFAEVQAQANQFLLEASQGVSTLTAQAAAQILGSIGDFQEALGDSYDAVVAQLNGIVVAGKNNQRF